MVVWVLLFVCCVLFVCWLVCCRVPFGSWSFVCWLVGSCLLIVVEVYWFGNAVC